MDTSNIGVDLDQTLLDSARWIKERFLKKFGFWYDKLLYQKSSEWKKQLSKEQYCVLENMLCDNKNYEGIQAFPHAVSTVKWLIKQGCKVDFISSRSDRVLAGTEVCLKREFDPDIPPKCHLVGYEKRGLAKIKVMRDLKADIMIEDDPETIELMVFHGIFCIMVENHYTVNHTFSRDVEEKVFRVKDWQEIESFFYNYLRLKA